MSTHKSTRRGAMHPFFFSCLILSVDAYSMRIMRNVRGTKEFTMETRATTMLHFHSREAPREANFACPKSPKIFTTFTFSLPRGQRSSRNLEQSLGVFMVSSSRSRRLVCVTLSLSCSAVIVRALVDNRLSLIHARSAHNYFVSILVKRVVIIFFIESSVTCNNDQLFLLRTRMRLTQFVLSL